MDRIKRCKVVEYYEILGVERSCTDTEIKKAYRKHALTLHPDKNSAPGADEAFKLVSKAFQILSDPSKRAAFDRHGGDPEQRGHASNAPAGFGMARAGGDFYGDEVSPEDLFNAFFGSGGFGHTTFGGPGFGGINFGGPGFRVHTFGNNPRHRHRRHNNAQNADDGNRVSPLLQLLPLIIIFILSFASSYLPGSSSSGSSLFSSTPQFRFDKPTPPFTLQRTTPQHNIPYYINPQDVSSYTDRNLRQLDHTAEISYVRSLKTACESEYDARNHEIMNAQGWFATDKAALERARKKPMPSCERMKQLGYIGIN